VTQTKPESFLEELKRRKVVRVALVYAAVAWGVAQVADVALSTFEAPLWAMQTVMVLLALGFPVAVVLAWAFEVTPTGVRRTTDAAAEAEPETQAKPGRGAAHGVAAPDAVAPAHAGSAWLSARSVGVILLFALVGFGGWYAGRSTAGGVAIAGDVGGGASIAVLPFSDLSGAGSNRAFTDGLHDDLLTQLSKIAALRVTSRTSVQEYRGSDKSIPTIAGELSVAAVLEGGVQRSGERLRINVQLIDGATDDHVWAETYDSDLSVSDIFDIQTRIATSIADALRANLTQDERAAIAEQPTDNFEAYEAYLSGLAATVWFPGDSAALLFDRATELDPRFAEAWAAAARAWSWQFRILVEDVTAAARRSQYQTRAERAVARARELAPGSRETRLAEGYFQYYVQWEFEAAARIFDDLLSEFPQDPEMQRAAALIDRRQGEWDRALERQQAAARLDPRNPEHAHDLAWTLLNMRRLDEAERVARLALAQDPENAYLNEGMGYILAARGASIRQLEPYWDRARNEIALLVGMRLAVGEPGLAAYYGRFAAAPLEHWPIPGNLQWSLALLAEAAGLPAAEAHADSAIAELELLDEVRVSPDAPLADRRAPAFGLVRRGLAMAIRGRRAAAEADLGRSKALRRPGEDHADDFSVALLRAYAWAILGNADEFFTELTPHAHMPSLLYARQLSDDPILSRFAADPRYDELIRALESPLDPGR
jgi:TolB-like protein